MNDSPTKTIKPKTLKLSDSELEKIAHLGRLELSEEAREPLQTKIGSVVAYFDKLDELQESGALNDVKALSHVHGESNRFREDKLIQAENTSEILKNAPDRSGNFIKVPLMIDQGEHS